MYVLHNRLHALSTNLSLDSPTTLSGVFVFANGEKYNGEYSRHGDSHIEKNGLGTHQLTNGVTYSGQWIADKMNGKGRYERSSL